MSDLEQVLSEAERARAEAEAADRRAAELEERAEAARERARLEREAQRRAWAQRTVDAYDADLTAVDAAIQEAQERFNTAAVRDLPAAVEAYLAWGETAIRHYVIQVRVGTAGPLLGLEATPAEAAMPPPFSRALDRALAQRIAEISTRARDEAAAEIARMVDAEEHPAETPSAG